MSFSSQPDPLPGVGTFPEVLRRWAAVRSGAIAFRQIEGDGVREIDFGTLSARVETLATVLDELSLGGQRVVVALPGGIDFVIGFLACHTAGSVVVTSDLPRRRGKGERLHRILVDSQASAILTTETLAIRLGKSGDLAPIAGCRQILTLSALPATTNALSPLVSTPAAKDLALLQYTSGSTTAPRGVMLTHEHLIKNCRMISKAFALRNEDVSLSWLPAHHDMGLVGGILTTLLWGQAGWLIPPATFLSNPLAWLRAISERGVTVSGGPDFAYRWCVERIPQDQVRSLDLSRWRIAFTGAERIRPETLLRFSRHFAPAGFKSEAFFPCYGLAEATLLVTGGPPGVVVTQAFERESLNQGKARPTVSGETSAENHLVLTASGRPADGVDVMIAAPDGTGSRGARELGEIWIRSPSAGLGYWNNDGATRDVFTPKLPGSRHSWLRTGDIGFFHEDRLYVMGRLIDRLNIRGTNVYPEDLESSVEESVAGLVSGGVAVISIDKGGNDAIAVLAEKSRDLGESEESVAQAIRNCLATEHGLATDEILVLKRGSLPRTSSGKIRRQACRELLKCSRFSASPDDGSHSDANNRRTKTTGLVMEEIACRLQTSPSSLNLSTRLDSELGLDSLGRVTLLHQLAEARNLRLRETLLGIPETVGDLVRMLEGAVSAAPRNTDQPDSFDQFQEITRFHQTRDRLLSEGFEDPYFRLYEDLGGGLSAIEGRKLVQFGCYNYLGLSLHPSISEAAALAARDSGTSAGASRLVTGNRSVHVALEDSLSRFLGMEATLAFVGGHATNETVLGHLFGPGDLILHDRLAHNSLIEGARLSGARRWAFPHNDAEALETILKAHRQDFHRVIIVIEGIYSMDGDIPDLPRFLELKRRHRCLLMVDEAHSLGTLGETGRGIAEHFQVPAREIDLLMGTLSKAFASCGGFISGSRLLVDYLSHTTPGFVYSVGMPPTSAAAALAALSVLDREPERVLRLHTLSRYFHAAAKARGIAVGGVPGTPVIPLLTGDPHTTLTLSRILENAGFVVPPVLPPAVPEDGARLRFFLTSEHQESQVDSLLDVIAKHHSPVPNQPGPFVTVS
ncbi:MAG: aminotransferase class I/II-fold pyridoxal phosphate-dependent enzyme [Verrucomicrobiae bacterium]|nr:aminotransferase class I/II-fold pyridoxal phosphate-dependent enzyme [Verrucomicrobiae bacterium]